MLHLWICENRFYYSVWKQALRPWKFDLARSIVATGTWRFLWFKFCNKKPPDFHFSKTRLSDRLFEFAPKTFIGFYGVCGFPWRILLTICSWGMCHWRSLKKEAAGFSEILFTTKFRRSQWPRGLRCWPAAVLLRLWVQIPPGAWMSVVSAVCCQVEVSATSWSLVQRSPTDCGVSLCAI